MRDGISTAELLEVTGAKARDFDNWVSRIPLTTSFEQKGRGAARTFSRENTIEIALIAALAEAGVSARAAAQRVSRLLNDWKLGHGQEWAIFLWGATGDAIAVLCSEKSPFNNRKVMRVLLESYVFTVLRTGNIVRRVDKVFKQKPASKAA